MTDDYKPKAMVTDDGVLLVHVELNGKVAMLSCPLEMWPEFRGFLFTVQGALETAALIGDPAEDVPPLGGKAWN